jgi:hypothetical protein
VYANGSNKLLIMCATNGIISSDKRNNTFFLTYSGYKPLFIYILTKANSCVAKNGNRPCYCATYHWVFGKNSSALMGWITTGPGQDMFIYGLFNDATSKGKSKVHLRTGHEDAKGD